MRVGTLRPWVLPLVFTIVTLSLPAQMLVERRFSEPFPGFFFPRFGPVPLVSDNGIEYLETRYFVNGHRLNPKYVFGGGISSRPRLRALAASTFPHLPADGFKVPTADARQIRANIARGTGEPPPTQLTVEWKRLRFSAETGRSTDVRTDTYYQVDLLSGQLR